jgi:hypothetical protein
MKNINKKILVAALISLSVLFVFAATEQWKFPVTMQIAQVVADGYGGCAISAVETNGYVTIHWLDKKGNAKYTSDPYPGFIPGIIQSCSKKQLTYMSLIPIPLLVQVNKKGDEKPVVSLGGFLYGRPLPSLGANVNSFIDKKGFFVINVNTTAVTSAVVRYSYK